MSRAAYNTYEIILSWACNLHCSYCYEKNTPKAQELVPVQDIVNFIKKSHAPEQPLYFQFMGGEPLLQTERIIAILKLLKDIPEPQQYSLTTNLTIGTREQIETLAKCGLHFLVSLDGLQQSNDHHRGQGSFAKTMQGLAYVIAKNIPTSIRATITPETIAHFKSNFFFLNSLGLPFQWNFAVEKDYTFEQCQQFVSDLHTLYTAVPQNNDTTIKTFLERAQKLGYCIDPDHTISIGPDGSLFHCSGLPQTHGSIYSSDISYDTISKDFFVNTRDSKECLACSTYVYCKGGCAAAHATEEMHNIFCKTQRLMHVFVMENKFNGVLKA